MFRKLHNMNLKSAKLQTLSHPEFLEKVTEGLAGNVRDKMAREKVTPSWTDVNFSPNGKLHLIQSHDGEDKEGP
jgi:hypothetical protein